MTKLGTIIGTVPYMSPEQLDGKEVDARSDIFSLGAVLYEMVTGNRAFQGKSEFSVASAILHKDPPPISTLQPLTPPALERTIRVCLAKDPDERWQSASDLWNELRWISEGGSQSGAMTAVPSGSQSGVRTCTCRVADCPPQDRVDRGHAVRHHRGRRAAHRITFRERAQTACFPPVELPARGDFSSRLRGRHGRLQRGYAQTTLRKCSPCAPTIPSRSPSARRA